MQGQAIAPPSGNWSQARTNRETLAAAAHKAAPCALPTEQATFGASWPTSRADHRGHGSTRGSPQAPSGGPSSCRPLAVHTGPVLVRWSMRLRAHLTRPPCRPSRWEGLDMTLHQLPRFTTLIYPFVFLHSRDSSFPFPPFSAWFPAFSQLLLSGCRPSLLREPSLRRTAAQHSIFLEGDECSVAELLLPCQDTREVAGDAPPVSVLIGPIWHTALFSL